MGILLRLLDGYLPGLTSFFSLEYLAFFLPAAIIGYSIVPKCLKKYALLLGSLGFFLLISGSLVIYLLLAILCAWGFGLWLGHIHETKNAAVKAAERSQRKAIKHRYLMRCRWVLGLAAAVLIGTLLVLKYSGFFMENVNILLGTEYPIPSFVLPIGISFYTLQAVSYLFDVYRETIPTDRNLFRVGLFIAFFPQIVEGPICRYSQTAQQLWEVKGIRYHNLTMGLQRIAYGLMKKMVVADRLNTFVTSVFTDYATLPGGVIALGALCYTAQLYMDFSGAMDAVAGTAQIFGVTMPENFQRPFFSKTISEFWTRWHISLGAWFKDYIFYPVTMSKPMKNLTSAARKKIGNYYGPLTAGSIALLCVWLSNGLWHGAAWSYIFFGIYHFTFILMGNLFTPVSKQVQQKLRIQPDSKGFRLFQILRTCIIVVIGELFFRAEGLGIGMRMFARMICAPQLTQITMAQLAALGLDHADIVITVITLGIVFTVSLANERGISLRAQLQNKPLVVRWILLYALIFFILIFGAYGVGYDPVNPMYANF